MQTLAQIVMERFRTSPDETAIILMQSGQTDREISVRELVQRARAYAVEYERQGIDPGDVIVLILQHGMDLISAYWGAVLYGAIPSILPFLTEKLIPERYRADLASLVEITRPSAIVTNTGFEGEVRMALTDGGPVRVIINTEHVPEPGGFEARSLHGLERSTQDVVLLQHSSGTTGLQKGVALSHLAVMNQLEHYSREIGLSKEDVIVSWLPLYHDMGLIAGFLQPILMGVKLVMMSPFDWVRAPYRLMQAVSKYQGTLTWMPNFAFNFCAQKARESMLKGVDLSSWRAVINCSEPVRWESQEKFIQRFTPYGLRENVVTTCYAMAENVFAVSQGTIGAAAIIDEVDRDALQIERVARPASGRCERLKMLSSGRPIANTEVFAISPEGQVLGERVIGELAVRSDCMLNGYYNRPDETEKAFAKDCYLTGDYGYLANGEVFVSGRKKDLIIIGGKNIYPQDLEQLAMEVRGVHPGRAVAFGMFNEDAGTEEAVLVAEIDSDNTEEKERIREEIRVVVTRGSAVALNSIYLVDAKWLIKTSSGKIARLANREKYLQEISALRASQTEV